VGVGGLAAEGVGALRPGVGLLVAAAGRMAAGFSSFGHFERDQDHGRALHADGGALRPGGRFLLDFINRELMLRGDPIVACMETADTITRERTTFDLAAGRTPAQPLFHDLRSVKIPLVRSGEEGASALLVRRAQPGP